MTAGELATVGWGGHNSRTSLYGSALTLSAGGEAHLVNHLMPSGTTIQEWHSFTDYQALRDAPSLPLLHRGRRYRIVPRVEAVPVGTLAFEVRFLDRFGALVGAVPLHAPDYAFDYPAGGHSYTIRMINAGCDELRFTSLTLREDDGDG